MVPESETKAESHDNKAFIIDMPQTPKHNGHIVRGSPDSGITSQEDGENAENNAHKRHIDKNTAQENEEVNSVCINPLTDEVIQQDSGVTSKTDKHGKCYKILRQNVLLIFLLLGLGFGLGIGFALKTAYPTFTKRQILYIEFPGVLLVRFLKMVVLPLISSSLIVGMASLPSKTAGKIGGLAAAYYLCTTLMAVILGVILVVSLQPGFKGRPVSSSRSAPLVNPVDALLDLIRNAIPDNIVTMTFQQSRTVIVVKTEQTTAAPVSLPSTDVTNATNNSSFNATVQKSEAEGVPEVQLSDGLNVLGLVAFCVTFGVVIGRMGDTGKPFLDVCKGIHGAMVRLVKLVTWYSPIGICFLVMSRILQMTDPVSAFTQLGWYVLTVVIGLLIHGFIILPMIYFGVKRMNPFSHMWHASQALLTAFGTASSSATIPVTLRCMERVAKLRPVVCRFVLPVGGTINMDGTALYEAVAAIFIAQVNGVTLDISQVITVSLTATAAAIGAAGLPEGGLVTMVIVLASVGLPVKDVGLIYAVDWLLDRCRTTINVWGDCVGAAVVQKLANKHLEH